MPYGVVWSIALAVLRDGYGLVTNARLTKRPSELEKRSARLGSCYREKEKSSLRRHLQAVAIVSLKDLSEMLSSWVTGAGTKGSVCKLRAISFLCNVKFRA
jgi:hypothetical protein